MRSYEQSNQIWTAQKSAKFLTWRLLAQNKGSVPWSHIALMRWEITVHNEYGGKLLHYISSQQLLEWRQIPTDPITVDT